LKRFKTEQQQKVALAKAESEAAKEEAAKMMILADAQAYEIEKINTAIGNNPNYVKLQALEALKAIAKEPASKIYFMNGDSPSPLPLLNIGN
jgi:regulator of protease activity HflC (stomatin/prohibitin superfamily)